MRLLVSPRLLEMSISLSALSTRKAPVLAAFHFEAHHAAAAVHLRARQIVLRVIGAEWIEHARDLLLLGQEIGDLRGVLAMGVHAQMLASPGSSDAARR